MMQKMSGKSGDLKFVVEWSDNPESGINLYLGENDDENEMPSVWVDTFRWQERYPNGEPNDSCDGELFVRVYARGADEPTESILVDRAD